MTITGRSGDGGIDGIDILQVAEPIRASSSPLAPYTSDAWKEVVRDRVPAIELVDGEKLVSMLDQFKG